MSADCCVRWHRGVGHHGSRGTTAAAMVGVCVLNVTLPRHITKPVYYVILGVSGRGAIYPMGARLCLPYHTIVTGSR